MSAAHSRGMRASTTFQSMTDLKPGVGITVDGRPATVISLGVGPAGRPARFVQLEDGQVIRVERATCRGFDLQVTADDKALRRAARLINLGMANPLITEVRDYLRSDWRGGTVTIVHMAGCGCKAPGETRPLARDKVVDTVLAGGSLWADCATEAACVDPDSLPGDLDLSTLVGRPVTYHGLPGTITKTAGSRVKVAHDSPAGSTRWVTLNEVTLLAKGA